jgi:hypothetical protein
MTGTLQQAAWLDVDMAYSPTHDDGIIFSFSATRFF